MSDDPKHSPSVSGLKPPRTETGGWLRRSGYEWKLRVATYLTFAPTVAFLFFMASIRFDPGPTRGPLRSAAPGILLLSLLLAFVGFVVRARIRCNVCGLNLPSSTEARAAGSRRWRWIASLETCPICGDDGSATPESHTRWQESGRPKEEPYWSLGRVLIVIVAIAVMLIGLSFV